MKRRALLALLAAASALGRRAAVAAPLAAKHRLGVFLAGWSEVAPGVKEREEGKQEREAFPRTLAEFGYIESRNLQIDWRYFDMDFSRAPQVAAELVRLGPDVLLTTGTPQTKTLQNATTTIPIVTSLGDPVASGFTKSLARPGSNVTGFCHTHPDAPAKQIELLRRVMPRLDRLVLIGDSRYTGMRELMRPEETAAKAAGLVVEVRMVDRSGYDSVFVEMKRRGARAALINSPDIDIPEVARLALRHGVATMLSGGSGYVESGGLMGYDPFHENLGRRTAVIIDKLFRGVKVADIPWELPDRALLAINLRTAKTLGLTVPEDILLRADKVLE